jgi:hypothetical protein
MTQNGSPESAATRAFRPRTGERRQRRRLLPAPYRTEQGLVAADRRTYLDRRSAWIRDFSIDDEGGDSN